MGSQTSIRLCVSPNGVGSHEPKLDSNCPYSSVRWTEEKIVRVWTPAGFDVNNPPKGGWPVLYMNDAQNKFECWLAHQVRCASSFRRLRFVTS